MPGSRPAALGREIVLIPPRLLGGRRQRRLTGRLAADQIPAHRHHRPAALRPERGHDVGRPRTQSKPPTIASPTPRASISAIASTASTDCCPFRGASADMAGTGAFGWSNRYGEFCPVRGAVGTGTRFWLLTRTVKAVVGPRVTFTSLQPAGRCPGR